MKLKGILLGLLVSFLCLPLVSQADSETGTGTLTVHVQGIASNQGMLRVALFNSAAKYQDKEHAKTAAYSKAALPIQGNEVTWQVNDLPYGVYGIKLFHDINNTGELTRNFVGKPTEGVGFSNNPELKGHAPTFDEVKFTVNQPQTDITINMINP